MPELPEVETIKTDLKKEITGHRIVSVHATKTRSIRRHGDARDLATRLEGKTIRNVSRRGKYLVIELLGSANTPSAPSPRSDVAVIHLGMSGQLLLAGDPAKQPNPAHTHVVFGFAGGQRLLFVDPRTFGEVFVSCFGPDGTIPELAHLGFDPLASLPDPAQLWQLLSRRRTALKPLLMDQQFIAGIGNIYSDEILFAARLRFDRPACSLTKPEVRRLQSAISHVLAEAVKHRGSSLADAQYRDLHGALGSYQLRHKVYGREGLNCPRCARAIIRVRQHGRSSYLCERCQN